VDGGEVIARFVVLAIPLAPCGYYPDPPPPQLPETLIDRVEREVSCPRDRITVLHLGGDQYEATACDKRATFSCVKHVRKAKHESAAYSDSCMRQEPWTPR
jgi:hypothetical protein